ncbi:MAG: NlpC/p60-like transpeptidase [Deltaproteobacteria bacterium]|nr:NlpC/p60-like transpeptidase [Deltaproteobacteria bacterium]
MLPKGDNGAFIHRQSAHCESGSTSNLLLNYGIAASEPLVFGIGSGIFFGYFPFLKVQGMPAITYRSAPGGILKNTARRLGVRFEKFKFKDPEKAMDALDRLVDKGIPVGLQTGVYWLPYFPDALRFHFNAHTLIVYGRNGDGYLISDPVFDEPVTCSRKDLTKARFAKGMLAPKGKMYYLSDVREKVDIPVAIKKGIKETCRLMVKTHVPIIGAGGIRWFGKALRRWPEKYGQRKAILYLGHAVRMQEEIGTGGGGFRLMYAAFLQEAAQILGDDRLSEMSKSMTVIGDRWREFALYAARICKNRSAAGDNFDLLSDIVLECSERERRFFSDLSETAR